MPAIHSTPVVNNEVNEVMGSMPSWLLRYGNLLLLLVVTLLLSLLITVKYPDVLEGRVEIRTVAKAYTVTATLPVFRTGKIQPGQQVYVSMDKYPREEFGELTGTVISQPVQGTAGEATIAIALTGGLKSTNGHILDPGVWASGHCTVVVGREVLLAKLLPL